LGGTDQHVLSYLLASLSKEILQQVALCTTAAAAWKEIQSMFASQTRVRTVNTQLALGTTRKGNLTVAEYFGKMKSLGDEMAAAGRPLDDEELTKYIITGLDEDYTPRVSALCARVEPISISELYSQLMNFETRTRLLADSSQRSINATGRGGSTRGRGGVRGRNRGRGGFRGDSSRGGFMRGSGRGRGGQNCNFFNSEQEEPPPRCQVCFKKNHTAAECWHRFDESYVPDQKLAATASSLYQIDPNWYVDSRATYHILNELEKLSVRNKYQGGDQIHTASGSGMNISYIGHTAFPTLSHSILLKDILYVPRSKKNLISVHHLTSDNSVFIELHPTFFLIKDQKTKTILLRGQCIKGLYPLPMVAIREVCSARRSSINTWHSRLGHPSFKIVEHVISKNNLLCSQGSDTESVCNACQQAKSHQLPYSKSTSRSEFPLQLVYTDVCDHAPESVGRKKYYVSFLDDYSKFTWVYLIKFKSEVFQKFQDFQNLVERQFDRKILTVQSDWGGEYRKLDSFTSLGIAHHVSCPHTHQQNGDIERKHHHIVEVGLALLSHACP
jgi:hypothetical protein